MLNILDKTLNLLFCILISVIDSVFNSMGGECNKIDP